MKRVVAEVLRHRTVWQLVAIAALCVAAGLLLIYNSYSSTLRQIQPLLVLIFATGGAALFMAVVRRAEQGGRWSSFFAVVLGIAGLIAFVDVPIVHYSTVWWRTLHQGPTITRLDPQIDGLMLFSLMLGMVVFLGIYLWLLVHRFRVAYLEAQVEDRGLDVAIAERRAEGAAPVPAPGRLVTTGDER